MHAADESYLSKRNKSLKKKGTDVNKTESKGKDNVAKDDMHYDCCFLDVMIKYDVIYSEKLSVCARPASPLYNLRWLMKLLEISCHGIPWLLGNAAAILMTHQIWMHEILLNLFAVLIFDVVVVGLTKGLVRRNRPSSNKMDMFATVSVDKFSFPSGHATRAASVTCFLLSFVPLPPYMDQLLVFWALIVSVSRVMLGRHHILDVVCGLVIGILQFLVFIQYFWIPSELCEKLIRPIQEELHF